MNRGRCNLKRTVVLSLSKQLYCESSLIDLLHAEWLSYGRGCMWILLTIYCTSPFMYFFKKMKPILSIFSVFLVRVFCSEGVTPLLDQFFHEGTTTTLKYKFNHLNLITSGEWPWERRTPISKPHYLLSRESAGSKSWLTHLDHCQVQSKQTPYRDWMN